MEKHNIELHITANTSKRFVLFKTGKFAKDEDSQFSWTLVQYFLKFLSTQLTGLNDLLYLSSVDINWIVRKCLFLKQVSERWIEDQVFLAVVRFGWDLATPPFPPHLGSCSIQGRYWSVKIDDIDAWVSFHPSPTFCRLAFLMLEHIS